MVAILHSDLYKDQWCVCNVRPRTATKNIVQIDPLKNTIVKSKQKFKNGSDNPQQGKEKETEKQKNPETTQPVWNRSLE